MAIVPCCASVEAEAGVLYARLQKLGVDTGLLRQLRPDEHQLESLLGSLSGLRDRRLAKFVSKLVSSKIVQCAPGCKTSLPETIYGKFRWVTKQEKMDGYLAGSQRSPYHLQVSLTVR